MKKGFTLIELLVVVLIIGILSAIALPQYTTAVEKARATEAITLMANLRYAGERYRLQTGYFPGTDMSVLDIELPCKTTGSGGACTAYGSKNYTLTTSGGGTSATSSQPYVITATRTGGGTNYVLGTIVSTDGTATRCCGSAVASTGCTAATGEALKICKAIASNATPNTGF